MSEEPTCSKLPASVEEGILEIFYQAEVQHDQITKKLEEFEQKLTTLVMKITVLDTKLNLLKDGNTQVMEGMSGMQAAILAALEVVIHQHLLPPSTPPPSVPDQP